MKIVLVVAMAMLHVCHQLEADLVGSYSLAFEFMKHYSLHNAQN